MKPYKFMLSGGGTGGHIFPAIAIANELKKRYPKARFLFVGARDRMEMEQVPQAGYPIEGLWISGIQRKFAGSNFLLPIKLCHSLWKAQKILKKFQPNVLIGTGGFASGPLLRVAARKKIPYILQEQNSFAGITNKWLAKGAHKICVAYEQMDRYFPKEKIALTGNPVRSQLFSYETNKTEALQYFGLNASKKTLLIIGGSLGARRINELVKEELNFIQKQGYQILWQCGKLYYETYKNKTAKGVKIKAFIDRMDFAYSIADIIISRAGAGAVSELCLVGKAVLFIPSPNLAEDHQTKNATAIVNKKAAIMLTEKELKDKFKGVFTSILMEEQKCLLLGAAIKKLAKPNATKHIVDEIETLL